MKDKTFYSTVTKWRTKCYFSDFLHNYWCRFFILVYYTHIFSIHCYANFFNLHQINFIYKGMEFSWKPKKSIFWNWQAYSWKFWNCYELETNFILKKYILLCKLLRFMYQVTSYFNKCLAINSLSSLLRINHIISFLLPVKRNSCIYHWSMPTFL